MLRDMHRKRLISYLVLGLVLPWLTFLVACIRYGKLGDVLKLPERLFGAGYNYFALECLDAIPFAAVGAVAVLQRSIRKESQSFRFGVVAAAIATIVLSAIYQTVAWFNMLGQHPDSLIGIAFMIFPMLIAVISIVVGLLSWAIASVFLKLHAKDSVKG